MRPSAKLVSLATAVPPNVLSQSDVAAAANQCFGGRYDEFERLARVFKSSGIRRRHAVRPTDWSLGRSPGQSAQPPILRAHASFLPTPRSALSMPPNLTRRKSTRSSRFHRLGSQRPVSKQGWPDAWGFAPMSSGAFANMVARIVFVLMTRGGQYDGRPVAA
jgi:hypothetical protein